MKANRITWLLIMSCTAAVIVAAPTSNEDSSESDEKTTINPAPLPGLLPPKLENSEGKKTKRDADEQLTEKPQSGSENNEDSTKSDDVHPAAAAIASVSGKTIRAATEEQKPESQPLPAKPTEETLDIKKDESKPIEKRDAELEKNICEDSTSSKYERKRDAELGKPSLCDESQMTTQSNAKKGQKRDTEEKKDDGQESVTLGNKALDRPAISPSIVTLPVPRPARDVEGLGQPEKNIRIGGTSATLNPEVKKEEKQEKRETKENEEPNKSDSIKDPSIKDTSLPTIYEAPHERSRRAASAQRTDSAFGGRPVRPPPPPPPRPGGPGYRPGNIGGPPQNRPGNNRPSYNRPGYNVRPGGPGQRF